MKKILMGAIIISMLLISIDEFTNTYTRKDCVVTQINDGYVTVVDRTGNFWNFKDTAYQVGDKVNIKFHNNFTHNTIEDDEIKKVVFCK